MLIETKVLLWSLGPLTVMCLILLGISCSRLGNRMTVITFGDTHIADWKLIVGFYVLMVAVLSAGYFGRLLLPSWTRHVLVAITWLGLTAICAFNLRAGWSPVSRRIENLAGICASLCLSFQEVQLAVSTKWISDSLLNYVAIAAFFIIMIATFAGYRNLGRSYTPRE